MAQTATGDTYCITRYPVVVHIVDPERDRPHLLQAADPAAGTRELVERLGICHACTQFMADRLEKAS